MFMWKLCAGFKYYIIIWNQKKLLGTQQDTETEPWGVISKSVRHIILLRNESNSYFLQNYTGMFYVN